MTKKQLLILSTATVLCITESIFLYKQYHQNDLKYECFHAKNGWGYNILSGKQVIIHQETIPGKAGDKGFKEQQQADAIAQLVIEKLKTGQLPTITQKQLSEKGVTNP